MQKKSAAANAAKVNYEVEVLKGKEFDWGVSFDMKVNGITIYGCVYREYTNKEGKEGTMISFPAKKGNDGQYYNEVWFPISRELKENIIAQLEELV